MNAPDPEGSGTVLLRRGEERRILKGHPWVFSNEVRKVEGEPAPGSVVEIRRSDERLIGYGIYNPHSLIAVRLFSRTRRALDRRFLIERLERAASLRETVYPGAVAYRLVHGESDGLPGLIVDRYGGAFSLQTLALGMDRLKDRICDALEATFHPRVIVERNESALRSLEGLPRRTGVLRGGLPESVEIEEGDLRFEVDLLRGHKTGFYFDQRENRIAVRRFAAGARALDAYCNEGAFALHLAKAGATEVLGLDGSGPAVERAARNAALNGLEGKCRFEPAALPDRLVALHKAGERFDLIVADPPSFTRSRKNVPAAKRAYTELNRAALRILSRGGILATASCSHHITDSTFLESVAEAASALSRRVRLLEWRSQAPDHPVLPAMPETRYLKFAVLHAD